jgi:hypothetical protein
MANGVPTIELVAKETEVDATRVGRGNTIKHPQTGRWVKTSRVLHGRTGVISPRPGESRDRQNVWVTLEDGEKLEFEPGDTVIRKD